MGVNMGRQMGFSWVVFGWTPARGCGRGFGQKFPMGP